jgi:transposase-like protein
MAASRAPLTEQDRARILELHAQGMSRNDIAREVGRAAASVTKVVHEAGGTFDRAATKAATAAKQADATERKAAARLAELEILELMQKQVLDVFHGRKKHKTKIRAGMGAEEVVELDFIPAGELQQLGNARSSTTTIITRLDENAGEQAARSLLGGLAEAFGLTDAGN